MTSLEKVTLHKSKSYYLFSQFCLILFSKLKLLESMEWRICQCVYFTWSFLGESVWESYM